MDWLGADIDGPLVVIRALHFAATAMTTGILIFRVVVVDAAFGPSTPTSKIVRAQTLRLASICLALSVVSGVVWLLLEAVSMSGLALPEAMTSEVLSTVVNQTQFGRVFEIRFALAVILAGCLGYDRFPPARWLALAISLGLIAAIAWTGHAGSTPGEMESCIWSPTRCISLPQRSGLEASYRWCCCCRQAGVTGVLRAHHLHGRRRRASRRWASPRSR